MGLAFALKPFELRTKKDMNNGCMEVKLPTPFKSQSLDGVLGMKLPFNDSVPIEELTFLNEGLTQWVSPFYWSRNKGAVNYLFSFN